MAESYEYPPALIQHRPLQYNRQGLHPATLKLRHHFFLTRAKIVFHEVFAGCIITSQGEIFLQEELVCIS
jgi:hypothetical protein